jgi:hypothetical protein
MKLTKEQIDNVFPPFSEKRRNLRKQWNEHNENNSYYSWDKWLSYHTEMELSPDLPF